MDLVSQIIMFIFCCSKENNTVTIDPNEIKIDSNIVILPLTRENLDKHQKQF
jgi:hypothetical protein